MKLYTFFRKRKGNLRQGTMKVDQLVAEMDKHNVSYRNAKYSEYERVYDVSPTQQVHIHYRFGERGVEYAWLVEQQPRLRCPNLAVGG